MPVKTRSGFERPNMQELIDRINGDLTARISAIKGNTTRKVMSVLLLFVPVLAAVMAAVAYLIYEYLDFAIDQFFIQTAVGDNLDKWGKIWDVLRKSATFAERTARIYGNEGAEIPTGRFLQRPDGFKYETLESALISGHDGEYYADVNMRATVAGADGNAETGTPLTLVSPIAGVNSAAEITAGTNKPGADRETDGDYRARILFRIAYPPSGGAPIDYIRWATAANNVQYAWCLRACPAPGYVTVLYCNRENQGDPDNPFSPIPPGGGAYMLPLAAIGSDDDGYYIKIDKVYLYAGLGRVPAAGWFSGGTLIHDLRNPINSASTGLKDGVSGGLIDDEDFWKIYLTAEPNPALDIEEGVHLLCRYTAAVYAEIHHRDEEHGVEDLKPSEATCYVCLPIPRTVQIECILSPSDDTFKQAAGREIAAMLTDKAGPRGTATNWNLHETLAGTAGHVSHLISDVIVDGVSLGANADISMDGDSIAVFGGFTEAA